MSETIQLVQGNQLPEIAMILRDSNTGDPSDPESWDPIDLSAGTTSVVGYFRARNGDTILNTIALIKDGVTAGKVSFQWPVGALDNPPGLYEMEIEIDFNGQKQTVYELLKFRIRENF